jgi:hypothetical protein
MHVYGADGGPIASTKQKSFIMESDWSILGFCLVCAFKNWLLVTASDTRCEPAETTNDYSRPALGPSYPFTNSQS